MQEAKKLIREFYESFDPCNPINMERIMEQYCDSGFTWRGCHPFCEFESAGQLCEDFCDIRHINQQYRYDVITDTNRYCYNNTNM